MLFNSVEFGIFLPIVFLIYWFVVQKNLRIQNSFLLGVSYFFYGWWDWRFLSLIAFSSLVDFLIGLQLGKEEDAVRRKWLLGASVLVNLGFLIFFKYFNFFIENFVQAFTILGLPFEVERLAIILPIGISFYTFQTLSYSIDIYKKRITPTKNIITFFAFVSFFPQLVAGPIERASNLLPQFQKKRQFDYEEASNGMRQILWGFFKKVVIADNCAVIVNEIFANYEDFNGVTLLVGGIFFIIQLYGDFSGYSDIAIGTASLFGFKLMQNFDNPYFATNTTDFWRKWHISLSTWFRDYIFTPLVSKFFYLKKKTVYVVTIITFLLLGIWHGANWTFVFFGLGQSIALCIEIYTRKHRNKFKRSKNFSPKPYYFFSWLLTMIFWIFICIIFRATDLSHAFSYIHRLVTTFDFSAPSITVGFSIIVGIGVLFSVEWMNRTQEHGLARLEIPSFLKYAFYFILFNGILTNLISDTPFIYFQF